MFGIESRAEHTEEQPLSTADEDDDCAEERVTDAKRTRVSPQQMDLLLYYVELYPFMWSPDLVTDAATNAWLELTGWLNLLDYARPMASWQQYLASAVGRIRLRFRVPLVRLHDRLLYNMALRTGSRVLDIDSQQEVLQRCGSVAVSFDAHQTTAADGDDDDDGNNPDVLVFQCKYCPQIEWNSGEELERHITAAGHFDIECVQVKPDADAASSSESESKDHLIDDDALLTVTKGAYTCTIISYLSYIVTMCPIFHQGVLEI